eukprot:TRINITY_DN10378_c0_g1_i1.p1 TRINITY_DN10378_c0_g1~~TRINITY_DN10378_c0_g1_i1.p1  ORF type:complete len:461 (+),score=40.73 TRINITY_DN10378_c0_g1_i1:47-1384(+)
MGLGSRASTLDFVSERNARVPSGAGEWTTYLLTVCLGVGSWITINGVFQQLPILVDQPEGWSLPSYITVVIQLANVCPIVLLGAQKIFGKDYTVVGVVVGLLINISSMAVLSTGVWTKTLNIGGDEHSVWLLLLTFTASAADCLSSVTFWPFVSYFKLEYLYTALSIGEGMSAVIPALLSFAQQPGADNPHFSANVFFMMLSVLMVIVGFCFGALASQVPTSDDTNFLTSDESSEAGDDVCCKQADGDGVGEDGGELLPEVEEVEVPKIPFHMLFTCSFLQNGALLSTQAYTTQPYSNMVYQVTLASSMFVEPLGSCLTIPYPSPSVSSQLRSLSVVVLCTAYQLTLASLSPNPPFASSFLGPFLTVGTSALASFLITYLKTVSFISLKRAIPHYNPSASTQTSFVMQRAGGYIQAGSFLGASLFFLLIVGLKVFDEGSSSGSGW